MKKEEKRRLDCLLMREILLFKKKLKESGANLKNSYLDIVVDHIRAKRPLLYMEVKAIKNHQWVEQ